MATRHSRTVARVMISPAVVLLLGWMLIPLSMTIYFSFLFYNLLQPGQESFAGWMTRTLSKSKQTLHMRETPLWMTSELYFLAGQRQV